MTTSQPNYDQEVTYKNLDLHTIKKMVVTGFFKTFCFQKQTATFEEEIVEVPVWRCEPDLHTIGSSEWNKKQCRHQKTSADSIVRGIFQIQFKLNCSSIQRISVVNFLQSIETNKRLMMYIQKIAIRTVWRFLLKDDLVERLTVYFSCERF